MQSIVYKRFLIEGLFPIYMEINDMNENSSWIRVRNSLLDWLCDLEIVMPWSSKYHAALQVGLFHFNFTRNNLMNISK